MKKITSSQNPVNAPTNFQELPPKVIIKDGDGLFITWHGSGMPSKIICHACGNSQGNKVIYYNRGLSYPNGNSWEDQEIHCNSCRQFTLINEFTEG